MRLLVLCFGLWVGLAAQDMDDIKPAEIARQPSAERVKDLVRRAELQGWGSLTPTMRAAAQQAYESNSGYASAWYYLYRWTRMLGTSYNRALQDWVAAIDAAKVGHPNMPQRYEAKPGSLAAGLSKELLIALLSNPALSEEFFQLLAPVDNPAEVLAILQKIHARDPALFAAYPNLAIAIAVVYDVPPPPHWPHGQVEAGILPRRLQPPDEVFVYFARLNRSNATLHRLGRLPASELKFLVDFAAPFSELDWARKNVPKGLADLGGAYDMIKYRKDRLQANQFLWPDRDYALSTILNDGGICVDQAYFASTTGKAKGIPTILFRGAGLDGRHAWFGYLTAEGRWQLDCGRYAEQKYVVGLAFDPQTWRDINDYELMFISERFRALPTYKLSVMHSAFAVDYLSEGKIEQAWKSAREAVNRDPRNLEGWTVLLRAQTARSPDLRAKETLLREAILAFQRYPDLEIAFSRQLIDVLRDRGETSLADYEEQRLGKKYQLKRADLSIEQAAATVARSMKQHDFATQIRIYNQILDTSGKGASVDFYDKVVTPFVEHLAEEGQVPAAIQALERARRTLRVEPGKMLEREMDDLAARLKSGKIAKKAAGG